MPLEPSLQRLFDLKLAEMRKARARHAAVPGADFLMARAAEDLEDRLGAVQRRFAEAAIVRTPDARATDILSASGKVERLLAASPVDTDALENEALGLAPDSLDLVVSLLGLHEVNDVPGILAQLRRALRPDGLVIAALPGQGTLAELRESLLQAETDLLGGAAARVYPFIDVRDAGALLQRAGFALPVTDVEQVVARYSDMFALMRDLRAMGATSSLAERSRTPMRRDVLIRAAEIYATRFADADGRVRATFNTVWMSGWVPHESQQKPLAPGSAKVSLAQALAEHKD